MNPTYSIMRDLYLSFDSLVTIALQPRFKGITVRYLSIFEMFYYGCLVGLS